MRDADPIGDARRNPDRPVGTGRDDPVDVTGPSKAVDSLLVLRGEDRPLVRERKADGLRIAIHRDHVHVAARPGGLEQAELGGAGA